MCYAPISCSRQLLYCWLCMRLLGNIMVCCRLIPKLISFSHIRISLVWPWRSEHSIRRWHALKWTCPKLLSEGCVIRVLPICGVELFWNGLINTQHSILHTMMWYSSEKTEFLQNQSALPSCLPLPTPNPLLHSLFPLSPSPYSLPSYHTTLKPLPHLPPFPLLVSPIPCPPVKGEGMGVRWGRRGWKEGGVGENFHCTHLQPFLFLFCQYLWW